VKFIFAIYFIAAQAINMLANAVFLGIYFKKS
jgi:hypothetical protein